MTAVSMGDHVRAGPASGGDAGTSLAPDADLTPGVYRVVGVGDGEVTLLLVTDGDGRRVNSGRVERVPAGVVADELDPAGDPDAGFSPVRAVVGLLDGIYWEVRSLLGL